MAEGHKLPRGVGGHPLGIFLKQICTEMQIWCIVRHNLVIQCPQTGKTYFMCTDLGTSG